MLDAHLSRRHNGCYAWFLFFFFFSSRRRHTRCSRDWSSDVCSSDLQGNAGPHGLSEILYAYTSVANNNGSAFGGLTTATTWYDTTMGIAMLIGRFFRSEERRVGKECRSRRSPEYKKKQ